ncbi:MAG TPA: aminopeptidase [Ktedonobacteraceae bacterium]|nr:aminopeptidase [Ktedonobacteraceae bacterium]
MDLQLQRMAKVLVNYSLALQKGEGLLIMTNTAAMPLVKEVVRVALQAGGYPEVFDLHSEVREITLREGTDEQIMHMPKYQATMIQEYETILQILADENTQSMNGIDPARLALSRQANKDLSEVMMRRIADGSLRYSLTMFPTNAYAQDTNMSLSDFEDFVYRACFLNEEDPVACWKAISLKQEHLISWLRGKHTIHLCGQDTDLTLSVTGRTWLNDDGHINFPAGEIYTSPVENSANGTIRFSFPASYRGRMLEDISLRFENGVVVEARAAQGQDYLEKMLATDEGACRLGEFAFGNNRNVDRCTKNILFDEKMGGTVHLALGASFPQAGGTNHSAVHWDMVCDLRKGGEVRVDGELFCKNGEFVI